VTAEGTGAQVKRMDPNEVCTMAKLLLSATIGLMLLSASASAETREHRAGQPGYTPGGGVTVQQGGRSGGRGGSKVVKVQPAPKVPQQTNWGLSGVYPYAPRNVRDHRGCLGPGAGPCAGAAPR
jgi:hypothetical protein